MALATAVAMAQGTASSEDFRGYLDQARFFVRRGWYEDAERELTKAVAHPDGWVDPEAWFMLASVRLELLDIEGARDAASRAHTYSRDEDQLAQSAGLSSFLDEEFGILVIRAPYPGMSARLEITIQSMIFDPTLKDFLERVQSAHRRKVVLPVRLGVPVGSYTVNGQEVEVPAQGATVHLAAADLGVGGIGVARLLQLEVGLGMAAWVGGPTRHFRPSLNVHATASLPLGPLRVAAVGDWIPTSYQTLTGPVVTHPSGGGLGVQVGWPIEDEIPFTIRPALGYRFGWIPGVELPCTSAGETFECGGGAAPELFVYPVSRAHMPYAELDVTYLDTRRTSDVGFGVKGIVEGVFGTTPAKGTATVFDQGDAVPFITDPGARRWNAMGFRVIAHLSVAF